jgi:hypothetical protein
VVRRGDPFLLQFLMAYSHPLGCGTTERAKKDPRMTTERAKKDPRRGSGIVEAVQINKRILVENQEL